MTRTVDENNPAHPSHSDYLISTGGLRAESIEFPCAPLDESTVSTLLEELDFHKEERCGFVTSEQHVVNVKNSHTNPRANFYMDEPDAYEAIDYIYNQLQQTIMGIYHTHPNGYPWPSPRDIAGWPNSQLGWRYFLVTRGNVTEWRLVRD